MRLKVTLNEPTVAVTVTAPGAEPAVAVTWATPLALVLALLAESVAGPLTENVIGTATAEPLLVANCTASGVAKAVSMIAVCPSPPTFVRLAMVTGGTAVTVKVADALLLVAEVTFIVTAPAAAAVKVTLVLTWPLELLVVASVLNTAAPAGVTLQVTCWPASGPLVPFTVATRGLARAAPAIADWPLPVAAVIEVTVAGVTLMLKAWESWYAGKTNWAPGW